MRLIDADALIKEIHDIFTPYEEEAVKRALQYAPTVDAVEVVRCKDCMFYNHGENDCESWSACERVYYIDVSENDFCSYGEKE